MARRKSVDFQFEYPFHVCGRAINKEWFDLPQEKVWDLMSCMLRFIRHAYAVEIHAFVLMANHYHMLIRAPHGNLSEAMGYFMRETSRELARASRRINMTYGGRFFRSSLVGLHHYLNAYKYVYRNPVQAGVVNVVEHYRWSTLRGLLGQDHTLIPVHIDDVLFSDVEGTLRWLNTPVSESNWEGVRLALKRKIFALPKQGSARKPHCLEVDLL